METRWYVPLGWTGVLWLLLACGGGSDSGNGSPSTPPATPPSNFGIQYTHVTDLAGVSTIPLVNPYVDWFVENADGTVRGPFESNGSGWVDLGTDGRPQANITRQFGGSIYYTFMSVPVGRQAYYTGELLGAIDRSITISGMGIGGQARFETDFGFTNWEDVTVDPYNFPLFRGIQADTCLGRDGLMNALVSYRSSATEDPRLTRYAFLVDQPITQIRNPSFNLATLHTRVSRDWQSVESLSNPPQVSAERKGQVFSNIGGGTGGGTGLTGTFAVPLQFPADRWYLSESTPLSLAKVVSRFDPNQTSGAIQLKQLDRFIVNGSFLLNTAQRAVTFRLDARGTDPLHMGCLKLSGGTGNPPSWDIWFPWSAVTMTAEPSGTTLVTLPLPALPNYTVLPAYNSFNLNLYRLDGGATATDMLQYVFDPKGHSIPSFAKGSSTQFP